MGKHGYSQVKHVWFSSLLSSIWGENTSLKIKETSQKGRGLTSCDEEGESGSAILKGPDNQTGSEALLPVENTYIYVDITHGMVYWVRYLNQISGGGLSVWLKVWLGGQPV